MKFFLFFLILFLFACGNNNEEMSFGKVSSPTTVTETVPNPYTIVYKSLQGATGKEDTAYITKTINASSGFWSTKVTVKVTTVTTLHTYEGTVIVVPPPPPPPVDTTKPKPPVDTVIVTPPPVTRKNLSLESTFETNYNGWNITDQTCCAYSAALSSDFARAGKKSMRIELRRGDPLISSSARAEIEPDAGSSNSESSEAWYGFSMYVPNDWFVSTNPESPIQFHQSPNVSGSEPVGLWIDGANFEIMVTKGLNKGNTYITGPLVKKGAWNDIVLHIKWDAGTNGIVQAWANGAQFADYKGVTNFPGQGYYAKVGAYKWYWQDASTKDNGTSRIYYFDEFRIGTPAATYKDVAP